METIITFVLGALSGLFLIGMIYTFIGVLKAQKEIKNLKNDHQYLQARIDEAINDFHRILGEEIRDVNGHIADFRREVDNINEQAHLIMGSNNSEIHSRVDEVTKYIDKRFDKAIDGMCNRMDIAIQAAITEAQLAPEELLKS